MTESLLSFEELKRAAASGEIDTVLVCMVDMQGRLVGKRFQVEFFIGTMYGEPPYCTRTYLIRA
jgi:glutamine synthetase